jgi:hypothetical protein
LRAIDLAKGDTMRVLHVLKDGPEEAETAMAEMQAAEHEVEIVDLSKPGISYEELVDRIFASDKVISW